MKKLFTVLILFCLTSFFNEINAQNIGGALGFGTEVESLGIGAFAQFPTTNKDLIIAPSFILFFPDNPLNFWELNANVNYVFSRSAATVYGILGLNLARVSFDDFQILGVPVDGSGETELGLNLGVGSDFKLNGNLIPFIEAKYAISDFDQLTIYGGLRFPF